MRMVSYMLVTLKFWSVASVQASPIRLYRYTFIPYKSLTFACNLSALISICNRVGLGKQSIKFFIVPAKFIPGLTRAIC